MSVTIIGLISALGFAGTHVITQQARKMNEISAAKSLMTAYLANASDHQGNLMPGNDRRVGSVTLPDGSAVSGPSANRYPYRLAPYFDFKLEGTILVNQNATQIDPSQTYLVSLYPALGMNHLYVGGDVSSSGAYTLAAEVLTNLVQAGSPLLVFASASNGASGSDRIDGYCFLTPPRTTGTNWNAAAGGRPSAADTGNLDPRYGGKAVCAFLDSSVRMHSIEELQDMRLWSMNAARNKNADYTAPRPAQPGRRR